MCAASAGRPRPDRFNPLISGPANEHATLGTPDAVVATGTQLAKDVTLPNLENLQPRVLGESRPSDELSGHIFQSRVCIHAALKIFTFEIRVWPVM